MNDATWQSELRHAISNSDELLQTLGLTSAQIKTYNPKSFACLAPKSWVARMQPGNPCDPLLLQTLPQLQEQQAGGLHDPLAEANYQALPGVLQKYHGRVLLPLTGACPIHCRYCFRRHFDYNHHALGSQQQQAILEHLDQDKSIQEVILSGGDPLSWSDHKLSSWIERLAQIEHLNIVRIHSRFPIILPNRITQTLLEAFRGRLQVVLVVHCNHPQELDCHTQQAFTSLKEAGITLLNQSVLLAGINDCAKTLEALSRKLFAQNILPYYLHRLDPVAGALHFTVTTKQATQIIHDLRTRLPGYLMPRWVAEIPHQPYKTPL